MLTLGESISLVNRCRRGKQLLEAAKRAVWLSSCSESVSQPTCHAQAQPGCRAAACHAPQQALKLCPLGKTRHPVHGSPLPLGYGSLQSIAPCSLDISVAPPALPAHLSSTSLLMLCCTGCTPQLIEMSSDALCHSLIRQSLWCCFAPLAWLWQSQSSAAATSSAPQQGCGFPPRGRRSGIPGRCPEVRWAPPHPRHLQVTARLPAVRAPVCRHGSRRPLPAARAVSISVRPDIMVLQASISAQQHL